MKERSLVPSSTENYLEVAGRFLSERFPTGKIYLKKLQARDVTDFLLHDSSNRGRRSVQLTATVLRSFLNFLFQKGRIAANLARPCLQSLTDDWLNCRIIWRHMRLRGC